MQHAACSARLLCILNYLLDVSHEVWYFCSKLFLKPSQFIDRMSVSSVLFGFRELFKITLSAANDQRIRYPGFVAKGCLLFWNFYRLSRLIWWTLFRPRRALLSLRNISIGDSEELLSAFFGMHGCSTVVAAIVSGEAYLLREYYLRGPTKKP
jgi:hypothetical protein